jgi:hypothetical protein
MYLCAAEASAANHRLRGITVDRVTDPYCNIPIDSTPPHHAKVSRAFAAQQNRISPYYSRSAIPARGEIRRRGFPSLFGEVETLCGAFHDKCETATPGLIRT